MGKHKPIWDPSTDCGDYVVVTNCAALYTTGMKKYRKVYYRHNTRPGSLRSVTMDVLMDKHGGAEVLRKAVSGMLPKNKLRNKRARETESIRGQRTSVQEEPDTIWWGGGGCWEMGGSLRGPSGKAISR